MFLQSLFSIFKPQLNKIIIKKKSPLYEFCIILRRRECQCGRYPSLALIIISTCFKFLNHKILFNLNYDFNYSTFFVRDISS